MSYKMPAALNWLLDEFRISERNEPFVGDLIEEMQSGRSKAWLWMQVLSMAWISVVTHAKRDIWANKLLSVRAIAVGLFVVIPLRIAREKSALYGLGDDAVEFWLLNFLSFALAGWVIANTHKELKHSMVLAFLGYATVARLWPMITHFEHLWSFDRPFEFLRDIALMATCFGLCFVASLGPAPDPPARTNLPSD